MFTGQGRRKAIVAQAVVYLVTLFLSVNLLIVPMASGEDAVVDNHIGIPDDSRNAGHEGRLSPDHSMPDLLRQRMEERRGGIRGQGDDVHSSIEGKVAVNAKRLQADAWFEWVEKEMVGDARPT